MQSKTNDMTQVAIHGHLLVEDDLGNILVDKKNAIHPQNMARVIARALANESNYFIRRIAFGNGGTEVDPALNITFRPPNDGLPPDTATYDSRLYNETFTELVNETEPDVDFPGEVGASDPTGTGTVSTPLGVLSQVVVTAVLNPDEPVSQTQSSTGPDPVNFDSTFTFDEIGLFTDGAPPTFQPGYQEVEIGDPASITEDSTVSLTAAQQYGFTIVVDGGTPQEISVTASSGYTVGDLITDINSTLLGAQVQLEFGRLRFVSGAVANPSSVSLTDGNTAAANDLFASLNDPSGATILPAEGSVEAGVEDDAVNPDTEVERMLTHVIFAPVQKTADRTLQITYKLTVAVARSV